MLSVLHQAQGINIPKPSTTPSPRNPQYTVAALPHSLIHPQQPQPTHHFCPNLPPHPPRPRTHPPQNGLTTSTPPPPLAATGSGSRESIAPETARDSFPSRYSLSRCGTRDGIGGDRWFLRFLPCVPRFVSDPCASACVVRDVLLRAALSVCQMACLSPCLRSGLRGGGAMVWRRGQRDGGFERCSEGTGNYPVGCRRVA